MQPYIVLLHYIVTIHWCRKDYGDLTSSVESVLSACPPPMINSVFQSWRNIMDIVSISAFLVKIISWRHAMVHCFLSYAMTFDWGISYFGGLTSPIEPVSSTKGTGAYLPAMISIASQSWCDIRAIGTPHQNHVEEGYKTWGFAGVWTTVF